MNQNPFESPLSANVLSEQPKDSLGLVDLQNWLMAFGIVTVVAIACTVIGLTVSWLSQAK